MSTFYYHDDYGETLLGVRCNVCGKKLYTERTGQEFPEHITRDARAAGWEHKKVSSHWKDFCTECAEEIRKFKRREAIHNDP